ncbi:IMP-specific 5-nucleotidase, partial [Gorgonomyces haynaldii]
YQSVFESLEELVNEHRLKTSQNVPTTSRLYQLCPSIGQFFTTLPLTESFVEIDKRRSICGRKHIPPSFNDIRHILNYAQIKSIAKDVQLITFDGDMTLYQDGADFSADSQLVSLIIQLLKFGVKIAIVTAAGYQEDPTRYEQRLSGLLLGFKASDLTHEQLSNFYVFGGECNFLFRFNPVTMHLVYIPASVYQPDTVKRWSENTERIQQLLDVAQKAFENAVTSMGLESKTTLVRKQRAVGIIKRNGYPLTREQLDELALAVKHAVGQHQFVQSSLDLFAQDLVPFCSFNGGNDVFFDIGNKLIGVSMLLDFLGCKSDTTLHVGDQFLGTGNDIATRGACCTVWITDPDETRGILEDLIALK